MNTKQATKSRTKLERKGWKVKNGRFIPPKSIYQKIIAMEGLNTNQALQLQAMVDSFYE